MKRVPAGPGDGFMMGFDRFYYSIIPEEWQAGRAKSPKNILLKIYRSLVLSIAQGCPLAYNKGAETKRAPLPLPLIFFLFLQARPWDHKSRGRACFAGWALSLIHILETAVAAESNAP